MRIIALFLFSSVIFASCGEDCFVGHSNYTFNVDIAGESRKAIILKPTDKCYKAPVLFYFHGRGGSAKNSQAILKLHEVALLNNMYIVYAEGTNYDNRPDSTNAWVVRFPFISTECPGKNKDLQYVQSIIDHLAEDPQADITNMGAFGHSNGGFFTLSLSELRSGTFRAFAAHGCYSSFAPFMDSIKCENSYRNAIVKDLADSLNSLIIPNPSKTLFIMPDADSTLHGKVSIVYKPHCREFSYFQNTVRQLAIKNNSELPDCITENYMSNYSRQIMPAKTGGEETQIQLYVGNHSWTPEVTEWMAEYFADILYP